MVSKVDIAVCMSVSVSSEVRLYSSKGVNTAQIDQARCPSSSEFVVGELGERAKETKMDENWIPDAGL